MKRVFYLVMAVAALSFVSCGGATTKSAEESAEATTKAEGCCEEKKECADSCKTECPTKAEGCCEEKKECADSCKKECPEPKAE